MLWRSLREVGGPSQLRDGPYQPSEQQISILGPRSRADGHIVMFALGKITSEDHIEDSTRSKCFCPANITGSTTLPDPPQEVVQHRVKQDGHFLRKHVPWICKYANTACKL